MLWDMFASIPSTGKPVCWDAVLFFFDDDEEVAFLFCALLLLRLWDEEFVEDDPVFCCWLE